MVKGFYSYLPFVSCGNGFLKAVRVQHFPSLASARAYCKENGITNGEILRYHCFRGSEDKSYSII